MGWTIRSQSKEGLVNIKELWIEPPKGGGWRLMGTIGDNAPSLLGEFSTKPRAIEEIDSIESWIEHGGKGVYQVSKE